MWLKELNYILYARILAYDKVHNGMVITVPTMFTIILYKKKFKLSCLTYVWISNIIPGMGKLSKNICLMHMHCELTAKAFSFQ